MFMAIGEAQQKMGSKTEAVKAYKEVVKMCPAALDAYEALAVSTRTRSSV
jgi:hypothetical protein